MPGFYVIGTGPGHKDYVLPKAIQCIKDAEVLLGSPRLLEMYREEHHKQLVPLKGSIKELLNSLDTLAEEYNCALLVTGDPGYHSLLKRVRKRFSPEQYRVIPGISAYQVACSHLGIEWQDMDLVSCHGQSLTSQAQNLNIQKGAIFLTDPKNTPHNISQELLKKGWENVSVWLCKDISLATEEYTLYRLNNIPELKDNKLCIMILLPVSTG
ncbi:precorrin-6y C5,15-methyltransferase (decarboxylating) subunit CbiE [Spirochaeta cellobiosiphila]|uniref:precorrin-6y C5,15-methyltransferase (decarboxylating) subunit CbiE n=1 Tax=Spirochaeta cellobiosiphila TaxID=504483 RepID=UPI000427A775|nr:precorrin-6y C5,15-methyltransferase (decarboxylating) subunit CbiE [Spirochaeta cellobiosiphila]